MTDKPTKKAKLSKARKDKPLKIRPAPPDDPIYTRDFVIGGLNRNHLRLCVSNESASERFERLLPEWQAEMEESMRHQFGLDDD